MSLKILSLVSNSDSKFYQQQIEGLRARGHTIETCAIPGTRVTNGGDFERRTVTDYAAYYLRTLRASLDEYDLIHANYGLTAPPAVAVPHHPTVVTLWGSDLMGEYGWVSRLCSGFADAVVVMSEEMASALDIDCHVIPHGVDRDRFRPLQQSEARAEVGWDEESYQVLFPYSRSRDVKDFPRAKRIVDRARRELAEPVTLQTMTGVDHERVPWYMNAADALLLTSKREGSPNTVKEALACNLPVISTDVGDVATQVDGVSHSIAASDDDVLVDGLVDTLRAGERSNGHEQIADLSLTNQLDRIEGIYRSVAATETTV